MALPTYYVRLTLEGLHEGRSDFVLVVPLFVIQERLILGEIKEICMKCRKGMNKQQHLRFCVCVSHFAWTNFSCRITTSTHSVHLLSLAVEEPNAVVHKRLNHNVLNVPDLKFIMEIQVQCFFPKTSFQLQSSSDNTQPRHIPFHDAALCYFKCSSERKKYSSPRASSTFHTVVCKTAS